MFYTSKPKKFRGFVCAIGLAVFVPFLCLTGAHATETPADNVDSQMKAAETRSYDMSRVFVTPVQRQWIEPAENPLSEIKIEIFDTPLAPAGPADISESELPVGFPIEMVDLAKFTDLKTKKDSRIYWGMEAILYQDTIYLLE